MKRVTGIGGIVQAKDALALQAWDKRHLGIGETALRAPTRKPGGAR
jgi:hypothetical protein